MLESPEQKLTLLYRGVSAADAQGRTGAWWSTNPYYALRYAVGGSGDMFVAYADMVELQKAQDASLEAEYQNYLFADADPPGVRPATPEEIAQLKSHTTATPAEVTGTPGGVLRRWPENAVNIGEQIFSPQTIGTAAVSHSVKG